MGWCSATEIFDSIMDAVLEFVPVEDIPRVVEAVAVPLWEGDWDCEEDSRYWHLLEPVYRKKFPWLFEDEDNELNNSQCGIIRYEEMY